MESLIDHLVVVAATREQGMQYIADRLGVNPQLGGKHERMGTHNALLKLNDKIYLEVIAIDPQASDPPAARWFGLDRFDESAKPQLITWVARTDDIYAAPADFSFGQVEEMSRDAFNWLIAIPPDGSLPMNGAAPTLIQWLGNEHPCDRLHDAGCELMGLDIRHPDANAVKLILDRIGLTSELVHLNDGPLSMKATIKTPSGIREL